MRFVLLFCLCDRHCLKIEEKPARGSWVAMRKRFIPIIRQPRISTNTRWSRPFACEERNTTNQTHLARKQLNWEEKQRNNHNNNNEEGNIRKSTYVTGTKINTNTHLSGHAPANGCWVGFRSMFSPRGTHRCVYKFFGSPLFFLQSNKRICKTYAEQNLVRKFLLAMALLVSYHIYVGVLCMFYHCFVLFYLYFFICMFCLPFLFPNVNFHFVWNV